MHLTISDLVISLEARAISIRDIFSIRRELQLPFRLHPLGFVVCTLMAEGNRKLRLHYWPVTGGRQQSPDCQIHDHIFEFRSWVLAGEVENIEYEFDSAGLEFASYEAEYSGDVSILRKTSRRVRLDVKKQASHRAGSRYDVAAGVLHETRRVGLNPAVTVLLTDDVSKDSPIVLGPVDGQVRYEYLRSVVPESTIDEMLGDI